MVDKTVLAVVAIVAALGLAGVVVVEADSIVKQIQAFAAGITTAEQPMQVKDVASVMVLISFQLLFFDMTSPTNLTRP